MTIKVLDNLIIGANEWSVSPFKFNVSQLNFVSGGDTSEDQLITSDDLFFITTDDEDFCVQPRSGWQFFTKNGQLFVTINGVNFLVKPGGALRRNYTIVGNVLDSDGIVNNFSLDDYIELPNTFSPADSIWELNLKFQCNSELTSLRTMFSCLVDGNKALSVYWNSGKIVTMIYNNSGSSILSRAGITTLEIDKWYWLRLVFTGTHYNLYLSANGEFNGEETTEYNVSNSNAIRQGGEITMGMGLATSGNYSFFNGTFDMNECNIKINNSIWWQGTKRI